MDLIHVELSCDDCGHEFDEDVEFISDIKWICPKCESHDVNAINIHDDCDMQPLILGRGGCGKQKSW